MTLEVRECLNSEGFNFLGFSGVLCKCLSILSCCLKWASVAWGYIVLERGMDKRFPITILKLWILLFWLFHDHRALDNSGKVSTAVIYCT